MRVTGVFLGLDWKGGDFPWLARTAHDAVVEGWFFWAGLAAFGSSRLWSPRSLSERYASAAFFFLIVFTFGKKAGEALPSGVAWAESGMLFLWVAPLALAVLCRALPERAGWELPQEGAARLGFWVLMLCGGWAGAARIASGPVPAWIGTAGIASALLLVLAAVAWLTSLIPLLRSGGWGRIRYAKGGGFLLVAAIAFPVWLFLVWLTAFRSIGSHLHLTLFDAALDDLAVLALGAMALLGFFARASHWHRIAFWFCAGGLLFLIGGEAIGGVLQALAFTNPNVPFAAVGSLLAPFLWMRWIGWGLFEIGVVAYGLGCFGRGGDE